MTPNDSPPHVGAPSAGDVDRSTPGEVTPTALDMRFGPGSVVRLSGELDIDSAPLLADALQAFARPGTTIELDLTELTFIDSSGIRVLCHAADRLGPHGRVVVSHATTAVRRTLELTGLDHFLDIGHDRSVVNRADLMSPPQPRLHTVGAMDDATSGVLRPPERGLTSSG